MNVTPNIIQKEFIGLDTKVVKSPNHCLVGITGKVVNETRNTFTILQGIEEKTVIKENAFFDFVLPDGTLVEIDGKILMGRPENRIKKRPRRLW
ncbi:ribonuclease P protein subunit [Candidatus Bathyarchaeota archaeon]|nr:ribonuclease P protein subunit [Candidatus Bathyarchaeota archaeon]